VGRDGQEWDSRQGDEFRHFFLDQPLSSDKESQMIEALTDVLFEINLKYLLLR